MTDRILNRLSESLQFQWDKYRDFIHGTPIVVSLLYDLDLMPEQIVSERDFAKMLIVVGHFHEALQTSHHAGYQENLIKCTKPISDLADRELPPVVYTPIEHRVMPNPYAKKFKIDPPKHIDDEM